MEVGHLHEKFKTELTKYLRFLLRFANKEEQFRKSPIYRSKNLDKISLEVSRVPLLRIDVGVVRTKNTRSAFAIEGLDQGFQRFKMRIRQLQPPSHVYEISSNPVLGKASDELFSILDCICQ